MKLTRYSTLICHLYNGVRAPYATTASQKTENFDLGSITLFLVIKLQALDGSNEWEKGEGGLFLKTHSSIFSFHAQML